MTSFREVPETEAAGEIAAIYDEIRRTYAVPYVSSLFRHLAIYPGLLPWAWQTLRPALLSGAAQHRRRLQGIRLDPRRDHQGARALRHPHETGPGKTSGCGR